MKKIFFSIVALAALAACSKTEVAYDDTPQEIGFVAVAGNITKAPISGTTYPEDLNLYVNAFTADYTPATGETPAPNYFANIEFTNRKDDNGDPTAKWGGVTPQYWPNKTALKFSGYSISGNIGEDDGEVKGTYNPSTDVLTITGYNPGTDTGVGKNDLMWFPATTEYDKQLGASGVTATMYHTCSWITFLVQGDGVTSNATSEYTITSLTMNDVKMTGNVICAGTATDGQSNIVVLSNENLKYFVKWNRLDNAALYEVDVNNDAVTLAGTYTSESVTSPKNIETGLQTATVGETTTSATAGGNIVVIPQQPTEISLAWTYKSPAGKVVPDSATGLSLKLNDDNSLNWEPGKHYVYTITVTASEILIAPTPTEWVDGTSGSVTVQ